jgi:hypothetical protein
MGKGTKPEEQQGGLAVHSSGREDQTEASLPVNSALLTR